MQCKSPHANIIRLHERSKREKAQSHVTSIISAHAARDLGSRDAGHVPAARRCLLSDSLLLSLHSTSLEMAQVRKKK